MKIYIVSGLGADFKVLERIEFPKHCELIFIDWLIPEKKMSLSMLMSKEWQRK